MAVEYKPRYTLSNGGWGGWRSCWAREAVVGWIPWDPTLPTEDHRLRGRGAGLVPKKVPWGRPAANRLYTNIPIGRGPTPRGGSPLGEQDSGAGVARAWRGRGAGYRQFLAWGGAGVARAWRGRGAGMSCSPWRSLQGGGNEGVPPRGLPTWRSRSQNAPFNLKSTVSATAGCSMPLPMGPCTCMSVIWKSTTSGRILFLPNQQGEPDLSAMSANVSADTVEETASGRIWHNTLVGGGLAVPPQNTANNKKPCGGGRRRRRRRRPATRPAPQAPAKKRETCDGAAAAAAAAGGDGGVVVIVL
eukprot:gene22499-biopygen20740